MPLQEATKKTLKKLGKISLIFIPVCIFFPLLSLIYIILGLVDVSRNKPLDADTAKRYFLGNGILTWMLSPFNLFLDLISDKNKGIYQLADLPEAYRQEINALIQDVDLNKELIKKEMAARLTEVDRGMLFFKWYGDNLNSSFTLPCFHKQYKYIKTIGVSVFNQHKATSIHYGPIRITLRLLYNLSPSQEGEVYIQVAGTRHYWKNNPMFIFDDTLQHQSVNYSNEIRYCMFVDLIRPSKFNGVLSTLLNWTKVLTAKRNNVFYKKWVLLK